MISKRQESLLFAAIEERLTKAETALLMGATSWKSMGLFSAGKGGVNEIHSDYPNAPGFQGKSIGKRDEQILFRFFSIAFSVSSVPGSSALDPPFKGKSELGFSFHCFQAAWVLLHRLELRRANAEMLLLVSEILYVWCINKQLTDQAWMLTRYRYRLFLVIGKLPEAGHCIDLSNQFSQQSELTARLELFLLQWLSKGILSSISDPEFCTELSRWAITSASWEGTTDYIKFLLGIVRYLDARIAGISSDRYSFEYLNTLIQRPGLKLRLQQSPFRLVIPVPWPSYNETEKHVQHYFHCNWLSSYVIWEACALVAARELLKSRQACVAIRLIEFIVGAGNDRVWMPCLKIYANLKLERWAMARLTLHETACLRSDSIIHDIVLRLFEIRVHWCRNESLFLSSRIEALRKYCERHPADDHSHEYWLKLARLLSCLARSWFDFDHFLSRHQPDLNEFSEACSRGHWVMEFFHPVWLDLFDESLFQESPVSGNSCA